MINKNRIVPVTAIDLLSLYAVILFQNGDNSSMTKLAASTIEGDFAISSTGVKLCDQPLKKATFGSSITSGTIFFVPAYDYEGFAKTGATLTVTAPDEGIIKDGRTLYKASLSTNALTITKVGF